MELLIALAILAACIPAVFGAYLGIQKRQLAAISMLQNEAEFGYLESFLRSDLRGLSSVISIAPDSLSFFNQSNEKVSYSLKDGQFKRQVGASILNLNSLFKVGGFTIEKNHPGLIVFNFALAPSNRQIAVFLPNESK